MGGGLHYDLGDCLDSGCHRDVQGDSEDSRLILEVCRADFLSDPAHRHTLVACVIKQIILQQLKCL